MDPNDTATFGGLTLEGTIDMNSSKIIGAGAATTAGDVLVYGQSDAHLGTGTQLGTGATIGNNLSLGTVNQNGTVTMGTGINTVYSGGGEPNGLPTTPSGNDSAVSKAYVDATAQGLQVHPSCDALSATNIAAMTGLTTTVDGVLLGTDGMRVLLMGQTTGTQNGIWVVHSGAWTRATDMPVGYHSAGSFSFIHSDGTSYGATGCLHQQ